MKTHRQLPAGLTLILLLALLSVPLSLVSAATAVNEDFEDGVADGFTVITGDYAIVTDGSQVYQTSSPTARAVVGDAASINVSVEAQVKVAGSLHLFPAKLRPGCKRPLLSWPPDHHTPGADHLALSRCEIE
jgi:hypothetical protein